LNRTLRAHPGFSRGKIAPAHLAQPLLNSAYVQSMKCAIDYIKLQVVPPVSFGLFLAIEGIVLYGLFRAIVQQ
jgi:hypothetical protein